MKAVPLPLVGGAYRDETRPWSQQDTCNYLPCRAEREGTRSGEMLKTPPGLYPVAELTETDPPTYTPVRGTHEAEGKFFAVIGPMLYELSRTGVLIPIGSVPGSGRVSMGHNQISLGNEIVVVNGSAGYVYNTVTGVFQRITDAGYPGSSVVKFIDGYIIGIEPQGRYAFNSDVANALEYNTLDRFTSEVTPDRLMAAAVSNNELMLLSASSCEFFENRGFSQQPFRSKRITIDKGCASAYGAVEADNTVFWLGSDGYFYQLEGYGARRISTRPIEQAIRGLDWSRAFAFAWEDAGFTVIYWTFPDGNTWGWDTANQEWHRRESYGLERWRVSSMSYWNNEWYAGDFQKGRIWRMDWDYPLEGDVEFISSRTMGVVSDNQSLMLFPRLELVMDTGREAISPQPFPGNWVPISPENLSYTFTPTGTATLVDGVVSCNDSGPDSRWTLDLAEGTYLLRVTVQSFSGSAGSEDARFTWEDGQGGASQVNESGSDASFLPTSFEMTVVSEGSDGVSFGFSGSMPEGIEYAFLIEVFIDPSIPQGSDDHEVRLQYSDDGQPNFSNWDAEDIGEVGQYGLRIVWTRLGSARQRVFRVACSSPRKRDMIALVATIQGTDG